MSSTPTKQTAFSPGCILGAIVGDIIGSTYERHPTKSAKFTPLFHKKSKPTDDTILTVATMEALLHPKTCPSSGAKSYDYVSSYREFGRRYPRAGYGYSFKQWLRTDDSEPYNSWGNGSAMRVSPIGWAFDDREKVLEEAKKSAEVTHDHSEGIKGAQATALAVYLARTGRSKDEIKRDIEETFGYDLTSRTISNIRPTYKFNSSCQGSVPEALMCFLESNSVESAARLAVSLGGDADTQACIACGIAEAFYGRLDADVANSEVLPRLTPDLLRVVEDFSRNLGLDEKRKEDLSAIAVFPSICKILPQCVFNTKNPIIVGVEVLEGILKVGTPLCVPTIDDNSDIGGLHVGVVTSIKLDGKDQDTARKGSQVAIKIVNEQRPAMTYGRQFDASHNLHSSLSRASINALKLHFDDELESEDWQLVEKLKETFHII